MKIRLTLCAVLALLLVVPSITLAQDEEKSVQIKIHKIHVDCDEDDDCDSLHARMRLGDHHVAIMHGSAADGKGGFLGIALSDLTDELRVHFGVPEGLGVMVSAVNEDSPALRAGVEVGDVITSVDGEDVTHGGQLARLIRSRESGETVVLEVWRDGKLVQIPATLAEAEGHLQAAHRMIHCEDGEDCDFDSSFNFDFSGDFDFDFDFGCSDGENCNIMIQCSDIDDCTCVANGESIDCPDLSALRSLHGPE